MQLKQQQELLQVELIQRQQFVEFTQAWDVYMTEYESAAYQSLERLKSEHDAEII